MNLLRLSGHIALLTLAMMSSVSCNAFRQQKKGPTVSGLPGVIQRVVPCVVRVIGEADAEAVREQTPESIIGTDKAAYSVGSGFFISSDGTIATANHVISAIIGNVMVELRQSGRVTRRRAVVLSQDPNADVAILKIEGSGYPKVDVISPVKSAVGDGVGFAGYPLSLPFPVAGKGMIAAKATMVFQKGRVARNWLVLNASVPLGASGSPLFLEGTGQVIGLVSVRKGEDDPQPGIGYAASAEYLLRLQGVTEPQQERR